MAVKEILKIMMLQVASKSMVTPVIRCLTAREILLRMALEGLTFGTRAMPGSVIHSTKTPMGFLVVTQRAKHGWKWKTIVLKPALNLK